jgi:murein DD-endopeptidase MepM/ murein hydrolase activator NlpD
MERFFKWVVTPLVIVVLLLALCYAAYPWFERNRLIQFVRFRRDPTGAEFIVVNELEQCTGAPFVVPTTGWIGAMYGDSIFGTQQHSGLDIFGPEGNGVTPVYAAYDGYVTRLEEWTSAVIIRHPQDPLNPDRQIWTYYTHMADAAGNDYIVDAIPRGTFELPIEQGTLLGYQGDFNGLSPRQISTHLHFSIVKDDGQGQFLNETDLANVLDPSPYLGMRLNSACADRPPTCRPDFRCP